MIQVAARLRNIAALYKQKAGIRGRLLLFGTAFLTFALVTNTFFGFVYTRATVREGISRLQSEIAYRVAREIEGFMARKVERLQDLATALSAQETTQENQRLMSLLLLKNDVYFTEVALLDETGLETLRVAARRIYLPSELFDRGEEDVFRVPLGGGTYVSPVYTSDKAEPYVTIAVPRRIGPNRIVGVVAAELNFKFLWDIIGQIEFGAAGSAYLVNRYGDLIAHKDMALVLKRTNLTHVSVVQDFLQGDQKSDPYPGQEGIGIAGETVLSTYAPLNRLPWAVILEEPADIALAEIVRLQRYAYLLLMVGLGIGAGTIIWVSNRITRPILTLQRGAAVIGAGNLSHRVDVRTGDEIEELALSFNQMAEELQESYAMLEKRVEMRTKEISALYEVTSVVNQSLALEDVLQTVATKIQELFQFDATKIFLLDPVAGDIRVRASVAIHPEFWDTLNSFRLGEGIVGRVVETGGNIVFADLFTDPRYHEMSPTRMAESAGRHFLGVFAVRARSGTVGALVCIGEQSRRLTADKLRLIDSMTKQIGFAVENASLYEQAQRKSQQLSALIEINKDVAALLDREVLLPRIATAALEIFKVDRATFWLLEGNELVKAASASTHAPSDWRPTLAHPDSLANQVVRGKRVIEIRDVLAETTIHKEHQEYMRRIGYHSFLGVPLRVGGGVIGSLHLYSRVERVFHETEKNLIVAFADQAAIAIQNANLFAEVTGKTIELERINKELQEANQAKAQFLAAMSHELRTPLNVIIGNVDLIRDGFFGEIVEKQQIALEKVLRYSRMLLKLINDVLTFSRIEAGKLSLRISTFDINEILEHVQGYVEQLNHNGHLDVRWHWDKSLPPLTTDSLKLEEIIQNLIGNAFKFTPTGSIDIRVKNLERERRVEFSVADTGVGIDAQHLDKIFEEFHQLDEAHTGNYSGVGLGLSIVKRYLDLMEGDIRVESRRGVGSTFTFTLPYSAQPIAS
jgi:signal transduction histidine kinase